MAKLSLALIFLPLLFSLACSANPQFVYCTDLFVNNNNLSDSIALTVTDLASAAPIKGFANTTTRATDSITLYGLAQCQATLSPGDCAQCLADAAREIAKSCVNQSTVIVVLPRCELRYDTNNFLHVWDVFGQFFPFRNTKNASDPTTFVATVEQLLGEVREAAVKGAGFFANATVTVVAVDGQRIYATAQCTRDLDAAGCSRCLDFLAEGSPRVCGNGIGCNLMHSSCSARYETYDFLSQD